MLLTSSQAQSLCKLPQTSRNMNTDIWQHRQTCTHPTTQTDLHTPDNTDRPAHPWQHRHTCTHLTTQTDTPDNTGRPAHPWQHRQTHLTTQTYLHTPDNTDRPANNHWIGLNKFRTTVLFRNQRINNKTSPDNDRSQRLITSMTMECESCDTTTILHGQKLLCGVISLNRVKKSKKHDFHRRNKQRKKKKKD